MSHPRRRPAVLAALLAGALALTAGLAVPGGAAADPVAPVAGSGRGPDPYFPQDGNGGYDVKHYAIDVRYRPWTDALVGRTSVTAVTGADPLSSFHLDLRLTPDSVLVDGRKAGFSKPSRHELRVVPSRPLAAGSRFTVTVRYHGTPSRYGTGTDWDGYFWDRGEVAAVGEPQIGPWWFPANETPRDKASYDVTIRVPRGQQAVAGGALVSRRTSGDWTAWRWRQATPISTYLAFFVAGAFEIRRSTVDDRPVVYAVTKALDARSRDAEMRRLGDTPRVVRWLQKRFGPYPYRTMGGVVSGLPSGFALETASRPFYPWGVSHDVLVHELAHQWFGDAVSVRRWRDTWINEGFATYVEWLWSEGHAGRTVDSLLHGSYENQAAGAGFWKLVVSEPGPSRIFDTPVYLRGAMTLAALRCRIGAPAMASLLRAWVDQQRDGTATGAEFRDLASARSGQDLSGFFAHWLDDPTRPSASDPANGLGDCA